MLRSLPPLPQLWEVEVAAHAEAVAEFAATARAIPRSRWGQPSAVKKWSPAEITAHMAEVYVVLRRELVDGMGMQVRGSALRRWLLRWILLPRLLRGQPFPAGVRAPAETRPVTVLADQASAIVTLQQLANQFIEELSSQRARGPVWLTHAYFGRGPALYGLRLVTMHLRHHMRQVAGAAALNSSKPWSPVTSPSA